MGRRAVWCFILSAFLGCGGSTLDVQSVDGGGEEGNAGDSSVVDGPVVDGSVGDSLSDSIASDVVVEADPLDTGADSGWEASSDAGADVAPDGPSDASLDVSCAPPTPPDGGALITVNGYAITEFGFPTSTTNVTIQGQTVATAADGSFTVQGVTAPYDVILHGTNDTRWSVYVGLTRSDPTLFTMQGEQATVGMTPVSGTVTGVDGGAPVEAALLDFSPTQVSLVSAAAIVGQTFTVNATWQSGAPTTATLTGFTANTLPTGGLSAITAFGTQSTMLQASVPVTGVNLPLTTSVPAEQLTGSFVVSTKPQTAIQIGLARGLSVGGIIATDLPATGSSTFSYGTFASGSLRWTLTAQEPLSTPFDGRTATVVRSGLVGNETVPIAFPACSTQYVSPPAQTTTSSSCVDLAWTETPGSAYLITLSGPNSTPFIRILTDRTSVSVPFPLSSGQYFWTYRAVAPIGSIDDLTANVATEAAMADPGTLIADHTECYDQSSSSFTVP